MRGDVGAGLDIRVDPVRSAVTAMVAAVALSPSPRPWRGAARGASRCRWQAPPPRHPPSNRCPAERHAEATLTRPLLSAVVQDVPDIPEPVGEQSGAAVSRRHARHAPVGVEAQDVLEDDTGGAETPRRLVGGSDGGHGHVSVQAPDMMAVRLWCTNARRSAKTLHRGLSTRQKWWYESRWRRFGSLSPSGHGEHGFWQRPGSLPSLRAFGSCRHGEGRSHRGRNRLGSLHRTTGRRPASCRDAAGGPRDGRHGKPSCGEGAAS